MSNAVLSAAHRLASAATEHLWATRADLEGDPLDDDHLLTALAESAVAGSLILRERVTGAAGQDAARALLDRAWSVLGDGDLLYGRQLARPASTDPMEIYAHFTRAGYRHDLLAQILTHVHNLSAAIPNAGRHLPVTAAARLLNLPTGTDRAGLPGRIDPCPLDLLPEPWALDGDAVRDLAHAVAHRTDWGARPDALPAPTVAYLRAWLPVWVDVWTEVAQWELVGELLIADSCLAEPVCPAEAWTALAAAQRPDGTLPADSPAPGPRPHHHATVVAAIAGTLALSRRLTR